MQMGSFQGIDQLGDREEFIGGRGEIQIGCGGDVVEGIGDRVAHGLVTGSVEGTPDQLQVAGITGVGESKSVVVAFSAVQHQGVGEGKVGCLWLQLEKFLQFFIPDIENHHIIDVLGIEDLLACLAAISSKDVYRVSGGCRAEGKKIAGYEAVTRGG